MRIVLFTGILLLAGVLFGGCVEGNRDGVVLKNMTGTSFKERLDKRGDRAVLLDIRTPGEYKAGHYKGAVLLDYYSPSFREELEKLDKNKAYFIYCRSGNRSGKALRIMANLGFKEVYNLRGGISLNSELFSLER